MRAVWKKSCVPLVKTMPTTMQATVSAASEARIARVRSSELLPMIYLLPAGSLPVERLIKISFDIQKSNDIFDGEVLPVARLSREESQARTRNLLIEAARDEIVKKGFAQASVRDIADAAGFSLGAF